MFLFLIKVIFTLLTGACVTFFSFNLIRSFVQTLNETRAYNRRFVDVMKWIHKKQRMTKETVDIQEGDTKGDYTFTLEQDKHTFSVKLTSNRQFLTFVAKHREGNKTVLKYVFDRNTQTYLESHVSDFILHPKKKEKDIAYIQDFFDYLSHFQWNQLLEASTNHSTHGVDIVKGVIDSHVDLNQYKKLPTHLQNFSELIDLQHQIEEHPFEHQELFLQVIHLTLTLSPQLAEFDEETNHLFEHIAKRDIINTYSIYQQTKHDASHRKQIADSLQAMYGLLTDMQQKLDDHQSFEIERELRTIQQRYKKEE